LAGQPAYVRKGRASANPRSDRPAGAELNQDELEFLDVPAFLRRQAN